MPETINPNKKEKTALTIKLPEKLIMARSIIAAKLIAIKNFFSSIFISSFCVINLPINIDNQYKETAIEENATLTLKAKKYVVSHTPKFTITPFAKINTAEPVRVTELIISVIFILLLSDLKTFLG